MTSRARNVKAKIVCPTGVASLPRLAPSSLSLSQGASMLSLRATTWNAIGMSRSWTVSQKRASSGSSNWRPPRDAGSGER
jgi:hypothetical protein